MKTYFEAQRFLTHNSKVKKKIHMKSELYISLKLKPFRGTVWQTDWKID